VTTRASRARHVNGIFVRADPTLHQEQALRKVSKAGAVLSTLAGNRKAVFAGGVGAPARFNGPTGLGLLSKGDLVVADIGNHPIRVVTMEGDVRTLVGNGTAEYADGAGAAAAARFNRPADVAVDGEGVIVVMKKLNYRWRKIVGGQVTTMAGSSTGGGADGVGTGARFNQLRRVAFDEPGRVLMIEKGRADTIRMVVASLAPLAWMGPVGQEAVAPCPHQLPIVRRGELQIEVGEVSGRAFQVMLRHLCTEEIPALGHGGGSRRWREGRGQAGEEGNLRKKGGRGSVRERGRKTGMGGSGRRERTLRYGGC
jgi:hypothetical protein